MKSVKHNPSRELFNQIDDLLAEISEEQYRQSLEVFDGGTLGQQFRHMLEFYICLAKGITEGEVSYDKRERRIEYENFPVIVREAFRELDMILEQFKPDQFIRLVSEIKMEGKEDGCCYMSSVGREMVYAYEHTIHHLAIIKIGIQSSFPEIKLDEQIGVAPSTLKFRKNNVHSNLYTE